MKLSNITTLIFLASSAESAKLRGSVTTKGSNRRLSGDTSSVDLEQYFTDREYQIMQVDENGFGYINGKEVIVKYGEITLGSLNPVEGEPSSFDCIVYSNPGWDNQSFEFIKENSVERSFTASVTSGFKYNQSFTAKVGFGNIAEVSSTSEFEVSLSTTSTQTSKATETLKYNFPLSIGPYTTIEACALVSNIYTEPDFEAQIEISNPNPGPFYSIKETTFDPDATATVSEHYLDEFLLEKDGFKPTDDPNKVIYTVKGKFTGVGGRKAMVSTKYTCLRDDWTQPDGTCKPSSSSSSTSDGTNYTTESESKDSPALIEENSFPEGRSYKEDILILNDEGTAVTEKNAIN